jgi:ribosomal silencing factor RsfS
MDSKQLALLCRELADNKKAENIVILELLELSSVTDYLHRHKRTAPARHSRGNHR